MAAGGDALGPERKVTGTRVIAVYNLGGVNIFAA